MRNRAIRRKEVKKQYHTYKRRSKKEIKLSFVEYWRKK